MMNGEMTEPLIEFQGVGSSGWCHRIWEDASLCGAGLTEGMEHDDDGSTWPLCSGCGVPNCPACDEIFYEPKT